jgi:hypothetical protein
MVEAAMYGLDAEEVNSNVARAELQGSEASQIRASKKSAAFYVIMYMLALLGFMGAVDSVSTSSALPLIIESLSHNGSSPTTTAT